jgi:hemoglobin-like flavoprotein
MTPEQIRLVRESFAQVPAETAAELFYARLFELAPSVRSMFHGDLKQQGRKLMATLTIAVKSLDNLESILPAVRQLGQRHAGYGVTTEHYWVVGQALIWTLQRCLGAAFDKETEEAWLEAYGALAMQMMDAARKQAA